MEWAEDEGRRVMSETTRSIGKWSLETFGKPRDPAAFIGRALEEFVELIGDYMEVPENKRSFFDSSLDVMSVVAKYLKDIAVFKQADRLAHTESADIRIFLEHFNYALGVDGQAEVEKKMEINRGREWNIDPNSGTAQHK